MKREIISKPYYSNCFLEAMKAKLKNPKQVKIYCVSPLINERKCFHFLWSDGENDYDFTTNEDLNCFTMLFFKGSIRKWPLGEVEKYIQYRKDYIKACKAYKKIKLSNYNKSLRSKP